MKIDYKITISGTLEFTEKALRKWGRKLKPYLIYLLISVGLMSSPAHRQPADPPPLPAHAPMEVDMES